MRRLSWLALAAVVLFSAPASADWPMNRHDTHRTGSTAGPADLMQPALSWRRYIGGSLSSNQLTANDVNQDGVPEIVFITGGKVVAKHDDDSLVWESPPIGLNQLDGILDLNGDGVLDVVASGIPGLVAVVSGRDGHVEWRTGYDAFGPTIGAVRFADFNGDGHTDLYVADAACGNATVPNAMQDNEYAFTFAQGFGSGIQDTSTTLWRLEMGREYVCGQADVVADFTGDGHPDVVAFASNYLYLFDGTTGQKVSSGNTSVPALGGYPTGFSVPYGVMTTDVVDVDHDGHPDIVSYTNNSYAPNINSRAVTVFSYDATRPAGARLYPRWQHAVASLTADVHVFLNNSAVDLDGDGTYEIVTTFQVAGSTPTTYIYRGSDGTILVSIPGAAVAGVFDTGAGSTQPTLLLKHGSNLDAYRFASFATPPDGGASATPVFTIMNAQVEPVWDYARFAYASGASVQMSATDPDGAQRDALLLVSGHLQLWQIGGNMGRSVADYDTMGLASIAFAPETGIESSGPGLLLARSDGYLLVLDNRLAVLNFGSQEVPLPGVRVGGFYAGGCGALTGPVAADYGGTGASVFVVDSRTNLLKLNAAGASLVSAPTVDWQWGGALRAVLTDVNGDGMRDVLAIQSRAIAARQRDGTTSIFSSMLTGPTTESIFGDPVPLAASGMPLVFAVPLFDSGTGAARLYAVTPTGSTAFATTPIVVAGSGQGQITAYDVNADGRDDAMVDMAGPTIFYSGANGSLLGQGGGGHQTMPIVVHGEAGPVDVIGAASTSTVQGEAFMTSAGMPTFTSQWMLPRGDYLRCAGAIAHCSGGLRFSQAQRDTAHLSVVDAASGTVVGDLVLAGGQLYATDTAARAANANEGVLGDVSEVEDLGAHNPAFLVGSTDGHLYAIDACAAMPTILWSIDFRAPVGEIAIADYDGDSKDELVVEAADGFVYGVDTQQFPAPAWVYDTDPNACGAPVDTDHVQGDALGVAWAPVPGATSYEWALFTAGGTAVTQNPTQPGDPFVPVAATVTQASWGQGLVSGARYFFAVRAIGPTGGASPEAVSNGVTFTQAVAYACDAGVTMNDASMADAAHDGSIDGAGMRDGASSDGGATSESTGGSRGGCGCRVPAHGRDRGAPALGLLFGIAALARRKRSRRDRERSQV